MNKPQKNSRARYQLILTCEHAGNRIPREYAGLFHEAGDALASHRGWDPGALDFTRRVSRDLKTPFHHVMWSRLLVESNRAPTNRRIWSRYTAGLPIAERRRMLEKYWWPNRFAVEASVRDAVRRGKTVLHIAIHSFTPVLDGVVRNADVALLYDPARRSEKTFAIEWEKTLRELDPELRVRRNYPYRGEADGLPTWLRRKFPGRSYLGYEFEFNQALIGTAEFARVSKIVSHSIEMLIG